MEYEHWATLESVKALEAAGEALPEAAAIMAHIVGISELWIARVEGVAPRYSAWPELTIAEAAMELAALKERWLERCAEYAVDAQIGYRSSEGKECVNTFDEVLQEVMLHGAHHRGQIALLLRRSGHEPPRSTDFIPALRSQRI